MTARAAGHARIDFQPKPSGGRRLIGPGRDQKKLSADEQRGPGVARELRPIGRWFLSQFRRERGKTMEQPGAIAVIVEECPDGAVFLDNSPGARVGEFGDQKV